MAHQASKSRPSGVLDPNDNHLVFQLLDPRAQSLSTAVVQLLTSVSKQPWYLEATGVACLVKDFYRRSYYIQVFHMDQRIKIFEQEIYTEFQFRGARPDFYMFEADRSMAALYFANVKEADDFNGEVEKRLAKLRYPSRSCHQQQRGGIAMEQGPGVRPELIHKVELERPATPIGKKQKEDKNIFGTWRKPREKKIAKTDIGAPTNFIHLKGIHSSTEGFSMVDNTNEIEPGLRALFQMTGMDMTLLSDPSKKSEIEAFAKRNEDALRHMSRKEARKNARTSRPPRQEMPPPRRELPPPPAPPPQKLQTRPPRVQQHAPIEEEIHPRYVPKTECKPVPSSVNSMSVAPPPPPPPPPPPGPIASFPAPPPVNSKPAAPIKKAPDARANMLSEIRGFGANKSGLRHVDSAAKEKPPPANDGSIINVLQAKLDDIAPHLNHSSSEDEGQSDDEDWSD